MNITKDIVYVGVDDHQIDLFESQYEVPNGMSYNSYIIMDEKTAVMDSVDAHFFDQWLANIKNVLGDKAPDYIVVSHMEPDHSGSLARFMDAYPTATVVASAKAFAFMKQFYGSEYEDRRIVSAEGNELNLGRHTLKFIAAPMVHWPEVMMSYDTEDKVLFTADAFGKFGTLDYDDPEGWACEARRYYFGIVGKYGAMVQSLLKKVSALEVAIICPLHGPVLNENLEYYLQTYDTWSSYKAEDKGVLIAYTSVYGNTKKAVEALADELKSKGIKTVTTDLARDDMAEAVEDAFRYDRIVLATTTYNGDIFPFMRTFIAALTERGYQNRTVGFIENGTWAAQAARIMKSLLEGSKNLTLLEPVVSLKSAMNSANQDEIKKLADALNA